MKLVGLVLCRNEDWCIRASLAAALRWCDEVAVLDHASTDKTRAIVKTFVDSTGRVRYSYWDDGSRWDEMILREETLKLGRSMGGTHFAIIDADEILTANLVDKIRPEIEKLPPGKCLEVPMLAMWTLDVYQDDETVWSRAWLTLAFADRPDLTWAPAADGYQHHSRAPRGSSGAVRYLRDKSEGGGMHIQFANRRRLVGKHWLYAYVDHLRWPGRETPHQLSIKYSQALMRAAHLGVAPESWWTGHDRKSIRLEGTPWQEGELKKLLAIHGESKFEGIKLSEKRPV